METLNKEIPHPEWEMLPNMSLSWHRGKESALEVLERPLNADHLGHGCQAFVKHEGRPLKMYNYDGQIPESYFTRAWILASQYAYEHPNRWVHFVRQDYENEVPETLDNAPYRQVNGEMVKATEQYLVDNDYVDTQRGWYRNY